MAHRSVGVWMAGAALVGLATSAGSAPNSAPSLKVAKNGRHLVDGRDRPFLVVGDTAWSLIVQVPAPDVDRYLDNRHVKGFNSLLVNLLEHKFADDPPRTRAGLEPFTVPGDFAHPNDAYFEYAATVVRKAGTRGQAVWLCPAYLGYGGEGEGWFRAIKAAGPQAMRSYGRYVGRKFRDLPNIVWVLGGDYTPPAADRWTVDEVAAGIQETAPKHLMTGHGSPGQSAAVAYPDRKWLDINVTYSYEPALHRPVRHDYQQQPVHPLVMLESTYENEHNATPDQIRRQAYWAILSGACGQFFGNSPIWHFDGPGVAPITKKWLDEMDGQGSRDMAQLRNLFSSLPWHRLAPDTQETVKVAGDDGNLGHATTAITPERDLAITYIPAVPGMAQRSVTVRLDRFAKSVRLRWFDPTSGRYIAVPDVPAKTDGEFSCNTPGLNARGAGDWVLVTERVRR
jgi:hypothetical protein